MGHSLRHIVERLARSLDEQKAATRVDVLLLGPSVQGRARKHSAKLRKELLRRCPEYGTAVKGEHSELVLAAKERLGEGYDLCTYERLLARQCDLVVIIPDSPGSFAELGLFALDDAVCPKTLVLFNEDKERGNAPSYIRDGPRKAFEMRGAELRSVNYKDRPHVWKIVQAKIEKSRTLKMNRALA